MSTFCSAFFAWYILRIMVLMNLGSISARNLIDNAITSAVPLLENSESEKNV